MPCTEPKKAWVRTYVDRLTGTQKKYMAFRDGSGEEISLPCRQCLSCRLEISRQWAVRITHEAQMHCHPDGTPNNSFITLTYADEHLPADVSLNVEHWQKFMKRLRKNSGKDKILRFYHSGEYGHPCEKNNFVARPHYHAIIFGLDFPDQVFHHLNENGNPIFTSEELQKSWKLGFSSVTDVNYKTAAYVARYVMKKINGEKAETHYKHTDAVGTLHKVKPEYATMSRRPGIGATWFDKYKKDVFPNDEVIINHQPRIAPRYYLSLLQKTHPEFAKLIKEKRKLDALDQAHDNTPERLLQKAACTKARVSKLKRKLHDDS